MRSTDTPNAAPGAGAKRFALAPGLSAASVLLLCLVMPQTRGFAQSSRIVDHVDLGAAASRTAHLFQSAKAAPWNETVSLGTLILTLSGIQIAPGGTLRSRLKTEPITGESISVQVTLTTSPGDYGKRQVYVARIDGKEVSRASEIDQGGGPTRSFFLDLPSPRAYSTVEVAADPTSQAYIRVATIRVYALQSKIVNRKSKMGLALVSPAGGGYGLDEQTIRDTFHKLPRSPNIESQLAVLYNFSKRTAPQNAAEIERLAGLAEKTRVPIRIAFQVHWGGIPAGVSDGAGGTFTDLPYQQITFDPADQVEDPGLASLMGDRYDVRYGLTVPNRWFNTPWLTFNHPRLNQLRRIRLTQALIAWRDARERMALEGRDRLLPIELSSGEETVYWAKGVDDSKYTLANGGKPRTELDADFNPFVVAAALNDGVNLDPRDGLSRREREWLHRNMARQQQRIIDWMAAALPADPVRLVGATSVFAQDLPRRNLFTEPYAMPLFPMKEVSPYRPGMEVGYVQGGRSGGEYWSGATMLPWLLKERERGRIALPNLECSGADEPQLLACLQAAYACGARFATLYNWQVRPDTAKFLRAFADSIDSPVGAEFPPAAIGFGAKWEREYVAPSGAWGVNRIELYPQDRGPVAARITLRDIERGVESSVTTTIERLAGEKTARVVLPTPFHQEPGRRYLLSIVPLTTTSASFSVAADVRVAARLLADIQLERGRSRLVAGWQDARDLLDSVRDVHAHTDQSLFAREALQKAEDEFTAGRPADAYFAGIRAEQLTLPASFLLQTSVTGGRLAPYWISILNATGPVRATITTYSAQAATVVLKSHVAQRITLRWGSLETAADLSPNVAAEISLVQSGKTKPSIRPGRSRRRVIRRRIRRPVYGPPSPVAGPHPAASARPPVRR